MSQQYQVQCGKLMGQTIAKTAKQAALFLLTEWLMEWDVIGCILVVGNGEENCLYFWTENLMEEIYEQGRTIPHHRFTVVNPNSVAEPVDFEIQSSRGNRAMGFRITPEQGDDNSQSASLLKRTTVVGVGST
jgi:hypothetical protein